MGEELLGYGRQAIDEDDVAAVVAALRSDFLTQGPRVGAFEEALCAATGAPHAVCVSNASAGLHVAHLALGLGSGARVLTSANTFLASATAAVHCGAEVGFVDVEPETANMDLDELAERLAAGERADAVVAVHFAGMPLDVERLLALKREYGFLLIEDAAHALGARYRVGDRWYRVGEHPEMDACVLSFHPVKHVTSAEGGAVLTHDAELAARVRRLACHGVDPESGAMLDLGFNLRLSDVHAALGASQLAKLPAFLARRRALAARYAEELVGVELPPGDPEHAWHLYVIRSAERDALRASLRERGVGTQVHYRPVPRQPWFRGRVEGAWPRAEAHARTCLSIPLYPALSDDEQTRVIEAFRAWRR